MDTNLTKITLTGIDETTDLDQAHGLSARFPRLEWGILLGGTPTPRYPTIEFIEAWSRQCKERGTTNAMHLCGKFARAWIENDHQIVSLAQGFDRIQINVVACRTDIDTLVSGILEGRHSNIITQHNEANQTITDRLMGVGNHSVLFDASGGRGVGPTEWPGAIVGKACGYAGGMGPHNVVDELSRIERASQSAPFWIDMEGHIRTPQDTLDLSKCEGVLQAVEQWEFKNDRRSSFSL